MARPIRFAPAVKIQRQIADLQRLSKSIGDVNNKTLSLVGRDVYEAAKRGVGQTAPKKKRAGRPVYVEIDGGLYRDLSAESGRPRAAGKQPKSWAPLRFLYRDIAYFLDASAGTVVVGPYREPWLNQLHEFGGSVQQTAWLVGRKAAAIAMSVRRKTGKPWIGSSGKPVAGTVIWSPRPASTTAEFKRSSTSRTARYPSRPFIQGAASVQKALSRANRWFKDTYYPRPLR